MFKVPEQFRITRGHFATNSSHGNNGAFVVKIDQYNNGIEVIASDGGGWEHVSVRISGLNRCPDWTEMNAIKDMFWGPSDCVVQFHPPTEHYVNNHPYVLHLWRKAGTNAFVEMPPTFMV